MGNEIFKVILSLSISGVLVGIVLFALKPLWKAKFSKTWQYYIWLILIVRMLVPVTMETNIVQSLFAPVEKNRIETSGEKEPARPEQRNSETARTKSMLSDSSETADQSKESFENADSADPSMGQIDTSSFKENDQTLLTESDKGGSVFGIKSLIADLAEHIWLIWLFGVVLLFTLKWVDYRNFIQYLKSSSQAITDEKILSVMDDCMMDLGIKKNIPVYLSSLVVSPMMVGCIRPHIVLPEDSVKENLKFIFTHELIHYRHKDIWYKWLFQITMCIHWFNPLVYAVRRELNKDCELACDEAVMRRLNNEERKAYGNMILSVAEMGITYKNNVLSTTLIENKKNLKERLKSIMDYKKVSKWAAALSALCIGVIALTAAIAGAKPIYSDPDASLASVDVSYGIPGFTEHIVAECIDAKKDYTYKQEWYNQEAYNQGAAQAAKIYNDDKAIKGEDRCSKSTSYGYWSNDGFLEAKGMDFSGSSTFIIYHMKKEADYEMEYSVTVKSGKFKLVNIRPDGTIEKILEDAGGSGKTISGKKTLKLKQGRNCIKMVGYEAKLSNIKLKSGKLSSSVLSAQYSSEWEEKAARLYQKVTAGGKVNADLLFQYLDDMEEKDIAKCIVKLFESGVNLTAKQLEKLCCYADEDVVSDYFDKLIKKGTAIEYNKINSVIDCLDEKTVSRYLISMRNSSKLTKNQIQNLLCFADEDMIDDYLIKKSKSNTMDFDLLDSYVYVMDEDVLGEIVINLCNGGNKEISSYLEKFAPVMDEDDVWKAIGILEKKGLITEKQKERVGVYLGSYDNDWYDDWYEDWYDNFYKEMYHDIYDQWL